MGSYNMGRLLWCEVLCASVVVNCGGCLYLCLHRWYLGFGRGGYIS